MDPHHEQEAHEQEAPSPTIAAWVRHVQASTTVLDVAAGSGRHARLFAELGHEVTAADYQNSTVLQQHCCVVDTYLLHFFRR